MERQTQNDLKVIGLIDCLTFELEKHDPWELVDVAAVVIVGSYYFGDLAHDVAWKYSVVVDDYVAEDAAAAAFVVAVGKMKAGADLELLEAKTVASYGADMKRKEMRFQVFAFLG